MHTIGIDFGTTKTLVSHIHPQTGHPAPLRLGRGSDYLPTSIYVDTAGRLFFGDDAEDMIEEPSGCYLRGFKMQLGSAAPLHMYLNNGKPCILTAKELVKEYLRHIREQVQQLVYHGEPVTTATITRPVKFSPAQCEELKQAAHDAGFDTVEFTTEPEAAGLAFCRMNAAQAFKRSALIVDWGGGTLDFALVTREGDTIHTHSTLTDGDTTMGGEKFDELLWNYAAHMVKTSLNPITQLPKIRRGKEQLSTKEDIWLRLSCENGTCPPLHMSREDFNVLISPHIDKAVRKIQNLVQRIPTENRPEMLLLVGGSCKIPLIKERLENASKLPARGWHYSREAVAIGASLWRQDNRQPSPVTFNCHICGAPITISGEGVTCKLCSMQYKVDNDRIFRDGVNIKCGICNSVFEVTQEQGRCSQCGTPVHWIANSKKWASTIRKNPQASEIFNCHICGTHVQISDAEAECGRCSMRYAQKSNGYIFRTGLNIRCKVCDSVFEIKQEQNRCKKCGSSIEWSETTGMWVIKRRVQGPGEQNGINQLFEYVKKDEWGKAMQCLENGHFTRDTLQIALSYAHSETMKKLISRYL
ncbi:MAG: Hsp70 family protein [Akkermansia sp.]|nr:Hsp70 family protein [Akkermansia sp.]